MSDTISGATVKESQRPLTGHDAETAVLSAFGDADWLSIDEVAAAVPVTRRTALALVRQLEREGLIAADAQRRSWKLSSPERQQR